MTLVGIVTEALRSCYLFGYRIIDVAALVVAYEVLILAFLALR